MLNDGLVLEVGLSLDLDVGLSLMPVVVIVSGLELVELMELESVELKLELEDVLLRGEP